MSTPYRPRCCYLNCKSMQVWGEEFENDPEYQAGMVDFWCTQTMQGAGPDCGPVDLDMCSNPDRICFREIAEIAPPPDLEPERK